MNLKKGIFALILLSIVIFNTKVYIRHVNGSNGLLYNEIGNAYKNKKVNVTAHRGDSLNYPENTLSSILGAKELGADWIEIDVRKTIDNRLVVIHDSNLKRTTGIDREIYDVTYDEIKDLKIITVKTDDKNTTWLTTLTGYDEFYKDVCRGYHYVDFFTGVEIVNTYNGISILDTIEFVSEEDIRHYLISYDLVKNNYTKSELKELFDKIKEDNYKEIKEKETENKEKVK